MRAERISPKGIRRGGEVNRESRAAYRHLERPTAGAVGLQRLARTVLLSKEHLPRRAAAHSPLLHPALEGPQLTRLIPRRTTCPEVLEQGLRLELWRVRQHGLHVRPVLREHVRTRAPRPGLLQLRGQLAQLGVLRRRLPPHA